MSHSSTHVTDQESMQERLLELGQDPELTYYVYMEGSSNLLLNGPPSKDKQIGGIMLPSAMQIVYLTRTGAFDPEKRQAAREEISKMYTLLTQSVFQLNRLDAKEAKKNNSAARSGWLAGAPLLTFDTKSCICLQYQRTGDCLCDETCSALNGCPACL